MTAVASTWQLVHRHADPLVRTVDLGEAAALAPPLTARAGNLCGMDAATVRAMLEQHFASRDPDVAHAMYHPDALVEFPQSGERFDGVENLREWRSNYPASTKVEFRGIRGRDDLWVAEISISYDDGPWSFGISILEFRGDKIARESIYVAEGWEAPEWRAQWRSAP
jgi:hypothetical protein